LKLGIKKWLTLDNVHFKKLKWIYQYM